MNYEEKYKEALERARANYKADKEMGFLENCDMLELIFPELSESEDLEEVARLYADNEIPTDYPDYFCRQDIKDAFIAGAEWQYQKARGEFAKIKAKTWCEGFDAHKEQMLKEAVEGEVVKDISNKLAVTAKNVNLDKFRFGDKVRIIILPKEDGE